MDMGTSTMSTAATATEAAASATSSAMSMSMGGSCKISMLWNWYTIDSCFIASTWHITSRSMFAGTCIGVILLVMSLEFLRRLSKEYDQYILKQHQRAFIARSSSNSDASASPSITTPAESCSKGSESGLKNINQLNVGEQGIPPFRPHPVHQLVRATLHMLHFAVAYLVMLLAMYFNGYITICIVIGAWLGAFVFSWETVNMNAPKQEVTYCCG